jgi:hypothetical protein
LVFAGMAFIIAAVAELGVNPWQRRVSVTRQTGISAAHNAPDPAAVADAFAEATTLKERMKWVRKPDLTETLVRRFWQAGPGAGEKLVCCKPLPGRACGNCAIIQREALMENGERRLVFVVHTPSGPRVDFETYARHCETPWPNVFDARFERSGMMRVFVRPDTFFNREFPDNGEWFCIAATSPDIDGTIYLYAPIIHSRVRAFVESAAERPRRATVRIASRNGSHVFRQFELTELAAEDWVLP